MGISSSHKTTRIDELKARKGPRLGLNLYPMSSPQRQQALLLEALTVVADLFCLHPEELLWSTLGGAQTPQNVRISASLNLPLNLDVHIYEVWGTFVAQQGPYLRDPTIAFGNRFFECSYLRGSGHFILPAPDPTQKAPKRVK